MSTLRLLREGPTLAWSNQSAKPLVPPSALAVGSWLLNLPPPRTSSIYPSGKGLLLSVYARSLYRLSALDQLQPIANRRDTVL